MARIYAFHLRSGVNFRSSTLSKQGVSLRVQLVIMIKINLCCVRMKRNQIRFWRYLNGTSQFFTPLICQSSTAGLWSSRVLEAHCFIICTDILIISYACSQTDRNIMQKEDRLAKRAWGKACIDLIDFRILTVNSGHHGPTCHVQSWERKNTAYIPLSMGLSLF